MGRIARRSGGGLRAAGLLMVASAITMAACDSSTHRRSGSAPTSTPSATQPLPSPSAPDSSLPYYAPFVDRLPIPTFTGSCSNRALSAHVLTSAFQVIPLRVLKQSSLNSEMFAGVCINRKGPFPFIVDTGASVSVVDVGLARKVGLLSEASPVSLPPCTHQTARGTPSSMSVGGLPLEQQQVVIGGLSTADFPLMGILGEDVISSFSAVRFDYKSETMAFALPQHVGQPSDNPAVPSELLSRTSVVAPLQRMFAALPGATPSYPVGFVTVPVKVGAVTADLLIDTGAQSTLVTPAVASEARLPLMQMQSRAYAGLGCAYELQYFNITAWSLGNLQLPAQPLASLPNFLVAGGSFGSGTLQQYGQAVLDFADMQLRLGPLDRPVLASSTSRSTARSIPDGSTGETRTTRPDS